MSIESVMPSNHLILCYRDSNANPTILSSVIPFSSCLQSFPVPGSFLRTQLFVSGGQNIGVSASTSVFPMNIQDWFPLEWTGWISLQPKGLSRVFSNSSKASILLCSAFFIVQLSHPYMTTGKTIALTGWTLCWVFNIRFLSLITLLLSCVLSTQGTLSAHMITAPWPCLVVSSLWDP